MNNYKEINSDRNTINPCVQDNEAEDGASLFIHKLGKQLSHVHYTCLPHLQWSLPCSNLQGQRQYFLGLLANLSPGQDSRQDHIHHMMSYLELNR